MVDIKLKAMKLYTVDDQQIYWEVYNSLPSLGYPISILGISSNRDLGALEGALSVLNPDVLLMSTKKLDLNIIEELKQVRDEFPRIGIIVLLVLYNVENIRQLRNLAARAKAGMAIFLKQSLDRVEQLFGIITSVNEGQIILDTAFTSLMFAEKYGHPFLRELTARELEILNLMAEGYTNSAIAEALYIDIRTVQHHINNVYSKFKADVVFNSKHPRVSAARLYLETTGELLSTRAPV